MLLKIKQRNDEYSIFVIKKPPCGTVLQSTHSFWLSVDPLADKYPNLSPYAYCGNNPVRLVDEDGRKIGDFYDQYGTYLGTDGLKDNNVYIISDYDSQAYIIDRKRNKQTTSSNDVHVIVQQNTKYEYLQKAYEIYEQGLKNRGRSENGGAYDENDEWVEGAGFADHVSLSIPKGNATIHLHPWHTGEEIYRGLTTPDMPSAADLKNFKNFQQNIIVGMSKGEYVSSLGFLGREPYISFYGNSVPKPNFSLDLKAVIEIINRGRRIGKL